MYSAAGQHTNWPALWSPQPSNSISVNCAPCVVSGPFECQLCAKMVPNWCQNGDKIRYTSQCHKCTYFLPPFGRSWVLLGCSLGALGRSLGALWALFGRSWGALGALWALLGALGCSLDVPWALLGRSFVVLGRSKALNSLGSLILFMFYWFLVPPKRFRLRFFGLLRSSAEGPRSRCGQPIRTRTRWRGRVPRTRRRV